MILKVFSVFDSKAAAYLEPFFAVNRAVALRMFESAARSESHQFSKYAEDYTLFEICEFDQETGVMVMNGAPFPLGTALEWKTRGVTDGE